MGQTSGSNTGSLELLKKIGEQGEKLMPNSFQNKIYTSFSNSDDIKTVLQNLFDSYIDDKFYKVILRPEGGGASSIAEIYKAGVNLGVVKVRNHAGVDLIGTKNGTWTWDSYVTKSYIDNKINIMDSSTFMFDNTEANGNSQKAISFSKTFNTIPNVVICPSSTANPKGREMATIDVTKTGFTATLHNASGGAISPYATWIAIGN